MICDFWTILTLHYMEKNVHPYGFCYKLICINKLPREAEPPRNLPWRLWPPRSRRLCPERCEWKPCARKSVLNLMHCWLIQCLLQGHLAWNQWSFIRQLLPWKCNSCRKSPTSFCLRYFAPVISHVLCGVVPSLFLCIHVYVTGEEDGRNCSFAPRQLHFKGYNVSANIMIYNEWFVSYWLERIASYS